MLAVAKGPPTTFGRVVGGLPSCVVQEHAQVGEMVGVQMLLLLAERRELSSCSVLMPHVIPLLRFGGRPAMTRFILPDGEPRLQEVAGDLERVSHRAGEQICQDPLLFVGQVLWTMQEQGCG